MRVSPIFLAIISCAVIVSCKKNHSSSDTLPPITQVGANTFGCKINGQIWVPYSKCEPFTNPCREIQTSFFFKNENYQFPLGFIFGGERRVGNEDSYLTIKTANVLQSNAVFITQTGNIFDSLEIEYLGDQIYNYFGVLNNFQDPANEFIITKLDSVNGILAGTFNFKLINYPDTVFITEGRFDFKLQDYCKCSP